MHLNINSINLKRTNKILLVNFNLKIKEAQIVILSGDNGSGKTSLLEAICGIISVSMGKINLFHKKKLVKRYSDYIFYLGHQNALKSELSVYENLFLWTKLSSLKVSRELIEEKLQYFQIENIKNIEIKRLSLGQKRKVALTKLLLTNCKIWLLDEPMNGLDPKSEEKLFELINIHQKNKGITVLSSHKKIVFKDVKEINLNKYKSKKKLVNYDSWELL